MRSSPSDFVRRTRFAQSRIFCPLAFRPHGNRDTGFSRSPRTSIYSIICARRSPTSLLLPFAAAAADADQRRRNSQPPSPHLTSVTLGPSSVFALVLVGLCSVLSLLIRVPTSFSIIYSWSHLILGNFVIFHSFRSWSYIGAWEIHRRRYNHRGSKADVPWERFRLVLFLPVLAVALLPEIIQNSIPKCRRVVSDQAYTESDQ